jgi:hypothetical protein
VHENLQNIGAYKRAFRPSHSDCSGIAEFIASCIPLNADKKTAKFVSLKDTAEYIERNNIDEWERYTLVKQSVIGPA